MNFTRWSARLPGTQRRAAARTDHAVTSDRRGEGSVPAARAEQLTDEPPMVPAVDDLPVREVLDRVPALVALVHGPDQRIAYVNDAYAAAFGTRPLGAPAREALPELDELGLLPLLDQVLRSGKPRTLKSRKAPGGRSYTFTCTPVAESADSAEGGVLIFATDVTDHAEAAERLRASERRQRETAVTLQRSLLPQELEEPDDLRIAATYQPGGTEAAVGGDWYDVITLGGGRTALVIGDVMGRGVRAAAVMGQLRTAVRAYARLDLPPHEVLQLLDGLATEIDANQIATCVYAIFDPNEGRLVYASAGHLPILVRDETGTVQRADEPTGPRSAPAAGSTPRARSPSAPAPPRSSTRTAWWSAGTRTWTRESPPWSVLWPARPAPPGRLRPPGPLARRHRGPRRRRGRPGPPAPGPQRPFRRPLPQRGPGAARRSGSGPRARAFASGVLTSWRFPTELHDLGVLAASELVANSLQHGTPPMRLRLRRTDRRLIVEVTDGDDHLPRRRRAEPADESGRGIAIVATIASNWGSRRTPGGGKAVWCEFVLPKTAPA